MVRDARKEVFCTYQPRGCVTVQLACFALEFLLLLFNSDTFNKDCYPINGLHLLLYVLFF